MRTFGLALVTAAGRRPVSPSRILILLLTLAIVTLATRAGYFGNPNLHLDDQFYRLVGQRMLAGELPYVDIWDRKPLGLFLIYAGIALLGGDGVLQYQLVAALFAFATAAVIALFALRLTSFHGALLASILYLLLLPALGGEGGQAPLFYNMPMAAAALLTFDALERGRDGATRRALLTMLLCGLAMTVKQTTLFEGVAFGLMHLLNFRRSGLAWPEVTVKGAAMMATALLPTAAIFAAYALLGQSRAIWQATLVSVFAKGPIPVTETGPQIIEVVIALAVPAILAAVFLWRLVRREAGWRPAFFLAWAVGALAGYLSIPNFFDHYAIPLAVPLCVMAAPALGSKRGTLLFAGAAVAAYLFHEWPRYGPGERRQMERLVAEIRPKLRGGCLYVHAGPLHPYSATGACHPSPFVFPDHLESEAESTALPVDPAVEVRRILATRPTVIMTAPRILYARNRAVEAILAAELAKNYRRGATIQLWRQTVTVWSRKEAAIDPPKALPARN